MASRMTFSRLSQYLSPYTKSLVKDGLRSVSAVAYDDHLEGFDNKRVTLIPGDGVGLEVCAAVKHVFRTLGVPVEWDEVIALFVLISCRNFEIH